MAQGSQHGVVEEYEKTGFALHPVSRTASAISGLTLSEMSKSILNLLSLLKL
jgi:hypothetical protein